MFDLDGTLTTHDTLIPYLVRLAGPVAVARALVAALLAARRQGRDGAKAAVVRAVLANRSREEIDEEAKRHAEIITTPGRPRPWSPRLRAPVVERLEQHRALGHRVVIVSASLTPYVTRLGSALGVDAVAATEIEVVDGIATGRLLGANCRGPEKVTRVEATVAALDWNRAWAYGDSSGDANLLARAANPVWVRRGRLVNPPPVRSGPPTP